MYLYICLHHRPLHPLSPKHSNISSCDWRGGAALVSCLLISSVDEWLGAALFSAGLILIGISHGLQGSLRIITASFSIFLHLGAIVYFIRLHQTRKAKRSSQNQKKELDMKNNFSFVFTTLIVIGILQILKLTSSLFSPVSFYKFIPAWLVILSAGVIIIALWFSFWCRFKWLLSMLIANVIILALSLVVRGTTEWVINVILLLMVMGTAFYVAMVYLRITGEQIRINKIPLFLGLLLLIIILATLAISLI